MEGNHTHHDLHARLFLWRFPCKYPIVSAWFVHGRTVYARLNHVSALFTTARENAAVENTKFVCISAEIPKNVACLMLRARSLFNFLQVISVIKTNVKDHR